MSKKKNRRVLGRPVTIVTGRSRCLYISDDDYAFLRRLGDGNASKGLVKLIRGDEHVTK